VGDGERQSATPSFEVAICDLKALASAAEIRSMKSAGNLSAFRRTQT
jgi:hypothetical protein